MLKVKEKETAISDYIKEITKLYPSVEIQIMDEKISKEDAWIRIKVRSPRYTDRVLDTAVELQQKWYLERGVYIFVTVSGTGPL